MNFVLPSTGETGLTLVLKVVAAQLGPASLESEAGGLFIGDMIVHLLRNATAGSEQLRAVLPELLGALARRIETAKTATFMQVRPTCSSISSYANNCSSQSLIIPFAYLIHERRDELVTLLQSMAIGTKTGLDILITAWCENVEAIQGAWARNMRSVSSSYAFLNKESDQASFVPCSVVALCDLLVCESPALRAMQVKGDLIIKPETKDGAYHTITDIAVSRIFAVFSSPDPPVIMTRSRAKQSESSPPPCILPRRLNSHFCLPCLTPVVPTEWASVSFPVRALKILVNELRDRGEDALGVAEGKRQAMGEVDVDLDIDEDDVRVSCPRKHPIQ